MTTQRPLLLDLFCCAGGASVGYARAGFEVVGIDLERQPRYPYPFHRGDALAAMEVLLAGGSIEFRERGATALRALRLDDFAVIHASPPCQAYSITRHSHQVQHPDLVAPTRALLLQAGLPYIIENVPGAPLTDPLLLCGSMFGLGATDTDGRPLQLRRHRLFESPVWLMGAGGCVHDGREVGGVYGGGSDDLRHVRDARRGGYTPAKAVRAALLGIEHPMSLHELSQSIPPAYTEWIGQQLLDHLRVSGDSPPTEQGALPAGCTPTTLP